MPSAALENAMEVCVPVSSGNDLVTARREGRMMAEQLGFSASEATLIATAISELARNIVAYAKQGEIHLRPVNGASKRGIAVVASDQGPGIADPGRMAQLGSPASGARGLGLPGVRRIMDAFDISSVPGRGTTIAVTKWKRQ